MQKLIGLTGPAGSGKDTVAMIIRAKYDYQQIALADPIRRGLCAMFGVPEEYFTDRKLKERPLESLGGKTPRQGMQTLGTEWGRNLIDPDIWQMAAQREIDNVFQNITARRIFKAGVIVSDIRFNYEADWIRNQGGTILHIRRPNNPHEIVTGHPSEVPITPVRDEQFIINDGDINDLQRSVNEVMTKTEAAA